MTYRGAGKPMDIDQWKYMSEGQCFICHEKGHISKDCPKKKKTEVCALEVAELLSMDTKIEEVKE